MLQEGPVIDDRDIKLSVHSVNYMCMIYGWIYDVSIETCSGRPVMRLLRCLISEATRDARICMVVHLLIIQYIQYD